MKKEKLDEIEKEFFDQKSSSVPRRKNYPKYAIGLVLVGLLLVLIGGTYALVIFTADLKGNKVNTINTCSLNLNFTENNPITLLKAYPIEDSKALSFTPYELIVSNNNSSCTNVRYTLTFEDLCLSCNPTNSVCTSTNSSCNCEESHKIDSNLIRYQVVDVTDGNQSYLGSNPYNFSLDGTLSSATATHTYQIRFWIADTAVNKDLYVTDANDNIIETSDGGYIAKNFCAKVKADINAS